MNLRAVDIPWGPGDDAFERRVSTWLEEERAKREARRRLDAEERGPLVLPALDTLRARLARPVTAPRWRVEDVQPRDSRVVLVAQFKAGKTTLRDNYVRSLLDGDPFLGRYDVDPITDGTVAIVDAEMGEAQLDAWLRAQRIRHDDRLIVVPMRGRIASFNPLDDANRAAWAAQLRALNVKVLVLDCLRPVLDCLGLNEHTEAGKFLVPFDALLAEAGITEAVVVHHMGHAGERGRGDSRIRDWPDVEWRLVRRDDDPASARFLTCYGRDVDTPEGQLHYDALTRRLTIEDGSRRDAASREALDAVMAVLADSQPMSGRGIKTALEDGDHAKHAIDAALAYGLRTGRLDVEPGPKRAKLYRVSQCPGVSRQCPENTVSKCPAPYIGRDTGTHTQTGASVSALSGTDGQPFHFDPSKAYLKTDGGRA